MHFTAQDHLHDTEAGRRKAQPKSLPGSASMTRGGCPASELAAGSP